MQLLGKPILYGIPDGSVLGQTLFSLFFAPLEDVVNTHDLDCMMYAHDTQHYIMINSIDHSVQILKLEASINGILIWCTSNDLAYNLGVTIDKLLKV